MRLFMIVWLPLFFSTVLLIGQEDASNPKRVDVIPLHEPDEIVDVEVDGDRVLVLTHNGLETVDLERRSSVPVNLGTVMLPRSGYRTVRHDAIVAEASVAGAILWTGRLEDGSLETYLSYLDGSGSIRLEPPFISVFDCVMGTAGDIFVLGKAKGNGYDLLHHYSSGGEYQNSAYLPLPEGELKGGHLALGGSRLFIALNGADWNTSLFGVEDDRLVMRYHFQDRPGTGRSVESLFAWKHGVYLHSIAGEEVPVDPTDSSTGKALRDYRNEIYTVAKDGLVLVSATVGPAGTRYGMTPEGKYVMATLAGSSHLRRMPALTILEP